MRFNYSAALGIVTCLMASLSYNNSAAQNAIQPDSMPQRWLYTEMLYQESPVEDQWWRQFGDETLDSLISIGIRNNYDVLAAMHRIEMARIAISQTESALLPNFGISGGWTAQRSSGNTTNPGRDASNLSFFNLGVNMNWEIDIFGKIKQQSLVSKNAYQASRMQYDAMMVTVAAKIAEAYMQLRTLQATHDVLQQHIGMQKKVYDLTMARHEAGIASKLDVAQARTTYYSTMATQTSIDTSIASSINAIAILLGVYPAEIAPYLEKPAPMPQHTQMVSVGVPMELLRRRPDIVEAEYQLAQYAAAVGVAKKDFLPTLSLSGSIGTSAHNIGNMFDKNSFSYTVAPTLSWTIFDGKSRKYNEQTAREQMLAGIDNYNSAVLTAVQEVNIAMATYSNDLKYISNLETVVESSKESYDLSVNLYKQGLTDFINVANSQVSYLQADNSLVSAKGQALSALVSLYEALGGGIVPASGK